MKNNTFYFLTILFLIIFSSCKKEETPKPFPEEGYPTTYGVLSQSEWNMVNAEFQKINIYDGLYINDYGFMEGSLSIEEDAVVNEIFVTQFIDSLFKNYNAFLGLNANVLVEAKTEFKGAYEFAHPIFLLEIPTYFEWIIDNGFEGQVQEHKFSLTQQSILSKSFIGPTIYLDFILEQNKVEIFGNWFSEAFFPREAIYSEEEASKIAHDWIRNETGKNSKKLEVESRVEKTMTHKTFEAKVEIRECWNIYIQVGEDSFNYVQVDTQTGEVLSYYERGWLFV